MMRNILVLILSSLFFCVGAYAADVTKVKGSNALVDLKGEPAAPGDTYFTLGSDGKRRGILQITKVKGDKAIGKITKGKVDIGMTLEKRGGATASASGKSRKSADAPTGTSYWGGMVGLGMDKMSVKVNSSTHAGESAGTSAMSGIGYGATGFFDYELFPHIWFRGLGGVEGFNAAGDSRCGAANNSACNASIYYISLDFTARYVFTETTFRPWLGAGVALMFPGSKNSTALDSASISNTSVIQIMGGVDYFINKDMFIPVSIEYGMLPKSDEVDASWIEFRIGLGVPF
jgi:hypothetical protein